MSRLLAFLNDRRLTPEQFSSPALQDVFRALCVASHLVPGASFVEARAFFARWLPKAEVAVLLPTGIAQLQAAFEHLGAENRGASAIRQEYPALLECELVWNPSSTSWGAQPSDRRRRGGAHFTPSSLAREVTEKTLAPLLSSLSCAADVLNIRVCDPACGAGVFLEVARELLTKRLQEFSPPSTSLCRARESVARNCLFGIDLDPLALVLTGSALDLPKESRAHVRLSNALSQPPSEATQDLQASTSGLAHWKQLFPSVYSDRGHGFSAIVGNPPWVAFVGRAAQPLSTQIRHHYKATYRAFAKYRTLHGLFLEQCALALEANGRLGLIVPTSVADLAGYEPTRLAHDRFCVPDSPLLEFGDGAFDGVVQPCMAITSTRHTSCPLVISEPSSPPWTTNPGGQLGSQWPLASHLPPLEQALLAKLQCCQRCPSELFGERGYQTNRHDKTVLQIIKRQGPPRATEQALLTGTEVAEFTTKAARLKVDPAKLSGKFRSASAWGEVVFLIRQTARIPIAALSAGLAFRNSVLAGFEVAGLNRFLMIGYLNSSPIRWFHYQSQRDARQGMPQMKVGHLRALPHPPLDTTDVGHELTCLGRALVSAQQEITEADRKRLDELVARALPISPTELEIMRNWAKEHPPPKSRDRSDSTNSA